ncbi:MAG: c-type cytochrome [Gemmatimonadales bacterium]|nr:c-type cytochrome [Gemmatimonadales bacterium]
MAAVLWVTAFAVMTGACGGGDSPSPPAAAGVPVRAVRTSDLAAGPAAPASDMPNPYADAPGAEVDGRQLYQSLNCGGCHGGAGGGGIGPPLADAKWIYGGSDANIYASVVQGRPNGMPSYGPMLTGEPVWKLAAYVRTFSEHAGEEGTDE